MAQKGITIYTPDTEDPHIYAEDQAQHNRAMLGSGGSGIEDVDGQLACAKVDNNTISIAQGMYAIQGYEIAVDDSGVNLPVDSGTAGYYRHDLVIAEFIRGGGATADVAQLRVLKGTPTTAEETATDPSLTEDDLSAGGTTRQEAVYRLLIAGTILTVDEQIAPFVGNFYA